MFKRFGLAATISAALAAGCASASSVTVDYQNPGNVFDMPLTDVGKVKFKSTAPVRSGTFYAGPFAVTSASMGDFLAWCIDIAQNMKDGEVYSQNDGLFGGVGSEIRTNIDKLFSTVYAEVDTKNERAAFQFSLWEVLYDDGLDLGSGTFMDNGTHADIRSIANDYLARIAAENAKTGKYRYTFLASRTSQDLITVSAVPLPAAGMMLIAGLGGLAALRRRG